MEMRLLHVLSSLYRAAEDNDIVSQLVMCHYRIPEIVSTIHLAVPPILFNTDNYLQHEATYEHERQKHYNRQSRSKSKAAQKQTTCT